MKKLFLLTIVAFSLAIISCASNNKAADTKAAPAQSAKAEPAAQTPAAPVETVEETGPIILFDESVAIKDTGSKEFANISAAEAVKDMVTGWNLGNTLDATGGGPSNNSELSWGMPRTTKAMIDGLAASGIKTIRIPVSWSRHMDSTTYTVKPEWMSRVKEVVDWAIDNDMYVIINAHHDNWSRPAAMPQGAGYYPNSTNYNESARFLTNLWTQIGLAFNDGYDEHLVFETMNEPRLCGTANEWNYNGGVAACVDAAETLNKLNQVCVDAIRATGGNNQKRFISVPGLAASPDSVFSTSFKMPKDDEPGKLILSVHMYTPYSFAMQSPGDITYQKQHRDSLVMYFGKLNVKFIQKGYPVIIGEYGATNKNNLEERVKWFSDFITLSRRFDMASCLWDNGIWEVAGNDYNEHFGFYNRNEQSWYFPEIIEAITKSATAEN